MWLRCEMIWRTARKGRGRALQFPRQRDLPRETKLVRELRLAEEPKRKWICRYSRNGGEKGSARFQIHDGARWKRHGFARGVERDVEVNFVFVRLAGRTANADSSANVAITW